MELKSPHGEYSRYPYFDTNIVCPLCGKKMIPRVMRVNSHKRILGCFDVDGCRGYAVKGYLVDAALLEAYNTLEIKAKQRTVAMQRMLEIKAESPSWKPSSITGLTTWWSALNSNRIPCRCSGNAVWKVRLR